ncbi:MAG: extracellular solute-binding protein [Treponema sp.]|jgi:raffinose/stachyose/melibiose transport system substrate-binding protein|nr:extracellular solute-binding protein [Treponema sp.]
MKKPVRFLSMLFLVPVFILGSCGGSSSKDQITISAWHVWGGGSDANFVAQTLSDFAREHPNIKIEATAYEPDAFQVQVLKTSVAANEFADVSHAWAGAQIKPFVDSQRLLNLDKYLTEDVRSQLMPGVLGGMTFNGNVYGLPFLIQPCVTIYNKALFDEYNLPIPETYDDLVNAVKVFRKNGITPFCLGGQALWTSMMYYDMMAVRYLGAEACARALAGEEPFDSEGFLQITRMFADLVDMGAFDPSAVSLNRYEAEMEFKLGKIPVLLEGSWVINDMIQGDSAVKDHMVVRGFPAISGAAGNADILGGANDSWIVNGATKNPDEAFLVAMTLVKSQALSRFLNNEGVAAWKLPEGTDVSRINPYYLQIMDMVNKSKASVLYWDNIISPDLTLTHENLISDLLTKKIGPEEFVKSMQRAIDAAK